MVMTLRQFFKKRAVILCAFLVVGCNDSTNTPAAKVESSSSSNVLTVTADDAGQALPLLSLNELLSASDVKEGLSIAAANDDETLLREWLETLLKAASEVNLLETEMALLRGEQGLKYLSFQGMKLNYQSAFEQAFVSFADVDAVYEAYPAFQNLHERSSRLVAQRDALIEAVASELQDQNFEGDAYAEARRQWQVYVKSQAPLNP
jgi:hypothetical protein